MARTARPTGLPLIARTAWRGLSGGVARRLRGLVVASVGAALMAALASYHASDLSLNAAAEGKPANWLGGGGAIVADLANQSLGLASWAIAIALVAAGLRTLVNGPVPARAHGRLRALAWVLGILALAGALAAPPSPNAWPLAAGLGGAAGDTLLSLALNPLLVWSAPAPRWIAGGAYATLGLFALAFGALPLARRAATTRTPAPLLRARDTVASARPKARPEPAPLPPIDEDDDEDTVELADTGLSTLAIKPPKTPPRLSGREKRELQPVLPFDEPGAFRLPELGILSKPPVREAAIDEVALRQNAQHLESVLAEFGVRGVIDQIRPGPVVTLYELAPAAGVKSARVVALSDDIARSMSVAACRVSVVPGRNAIGIELPNAKREMVSLRDMLSSAEYEKAGMSLPLALGETIGGEPYIVDLAKMPHLLIAGTTGSGKSVGVNAMILSILYRLSPDQCRFIMIDPKMLELSVYDGIPHLLAPVVTEPKKAIVALKWTVKEMEDRYRRMSKIGVRNVAGYNERAREAVAKGEHFVRTIQTGFDDKGRPIYEEEKLNPEPMPYLVVVIDEVADLMMVAGKDIEGAVQRLAQMARAAGIHLIMATQRPSVDVITGTIKANFPTRIAFQVTSKIDARTIMQEQGAEQLLGMGDMLYMAGGGRVTRLHGPFVSDGEVERVAKFLRAQGAPQYLEDVTAGADDEDGGGELDLGGGGEGGNDLYDQAVAVVTRDRKASTSYIQRRLQIGYNRAASLIERMEKEGVVGMANHAGKREVLANPPPPL